MRHAGFPRPVGNDPFLRGIYYLTLGGGMGEWSGTSPDSR